MEDDNIKGKWKEYNFLFFGLFLPNVTFPQKLKLTNMLFSFIQSFNPSTNFY